MNKEKVRNGIIFSIFHWSISAWAIYGLIALTITSDFAINSLFFTFLFYPLLKEKRLMEESGVLIFSEFALPYLGWSPTLGCNAIPVGGSVPFHAFIG